MLIYVRTFLWNVDSSASVDHPIWPRFRFLQETVMNTNTLLIIIVVILLVGGGGFYGHGRWF